MRKASHLIIDIKTQTLTVYVQMQEIACYRISSSLKGLGEERDSFKTPRGKHRIRAKIGAGLPEGAVLVGRRFTGEIYHPALAVQYPERDWILSRILWLSGMQPGFNRLGHVDTMQRYIYIHGCPDSAPMGEPYSMGCIRMRNKELIALFDEVDKNTEVVIVEDSARALVHKECILRDILELWNRRAGLTPTHQATGTDPHASAKTPGRVTRRLFDDNVCKAPTFWLLPASDDH